MQKTDGQSVRARKEVRLIAARIPLGKKTTRPYRGNYHIDAYEEEAVNDTTDHGYITPIGYNPQIIDPNSGPSSGSNTFDDIVTIVGGAAGATGDAIGAVGNWIDENSSPPEDPGVWGHAGPD